MFFLDAVQLGDMLYFVILCLAEVVECGAGGDDAFGEVFDTSALQGFGLKMLGQQRYGVVGGEDPVFKGGKQDFLAEMFAKLLHLPLLDDHFGGFEIL